MKNVGLGLIPESSVYLRLVGRIFPLVRGELGKWKRLAVAIPDDELRIQALSSISSKAFHCMGGSVLALLNPGRLRELVKAIVAIQTVSDYLDNLCDRASASYAWASDPSLEAARRGFVSCMSIHEAFRCAVDPTRPVTPFYRLYPVKHPRGDGGYLDSLVKESRDVLRSLPSYDVVLPWVRYLSGLYSELQSIKHLSPAIREGLMEEWHRARWVGDLDPSACSLPLPESVSEGLYGDPPKSGSVDTGRRRISLPWWEFAAATGSTLGMFALICASSHTPETTQSRGFSGGSSHAPDLFSAYFPYISGLHILLDYYIDREEDRLGGDLNFVNAYPSHEEIVTGLTRFVDRSLEAASSLPQAWLHLAVVRGLLAMYLSDPKVRKTGISGEAEVLAKRGGPLVRVLRPACGLIRKAFGF